MIGSHGSPKLGILYKKNDKRRMPDGIVRVTKSRISVTADLAQIFAPRVWDGGIKAFVARIRLLTTNEIEIVPCDSTKEGYIFSMPNETASFYSKSLNHLYIPKGDYFPTGELYKFKRIPTQTNPEAKE